MVSPHGPPFSKIFESTSDRIDGPWIVTHIGQDGMIDDWWHFAPGKIAAPQFWYGNLGGKSAAIFPVYRVTEMYYRTFNVCISIMSYICSTCQYQRKKSDLFSLWNTKFVNCLWDNMILKDCLKFLFIYLFIYLINLWIIIICAMFTSLNTVSLKAQKLTIHTHKG